MWLEAVAEPTPVPEPAAPPPVVEREEPPPPPVEKPPEPNANFEATITRADGSELSGTVIRVERGADFYADRGWTDQASKLTVTLEKGSTARDVSWTDIREVNIAYASDREDIDCQYDSAFTPWMYMCVLRTTASVVTADQARMDSTTRHRWRFTFEGGDVQEFYLHKFPVRMQDTDDSAIPSENHALYADLQTKVIQLSKSESAVTRIAITLR